MKRNIQILLPQKIITKVKAMVNILLKADSGEVINKRDIDSFINSIKGLKPPLDYYITSNQQLNLFTILVPKKTAAEFKALITLYKTAAKHKSLASFKPKTKEELHSNLEDISKKLLTHLENILKDQKTIQTGE